VLIQNWFPQLKTQAQNLNLGYTKAAEKYPAYEQFSAIAGFENQTMTNIMLNGGNVDNILNALFTGTEKSEFNAELAAYQKSYYIDKKQRLGSAYGTVEPTKADITAEIEGLLSTLGLTAQVSKDAQGVITDASLTAIKQELKTIMLEKMDNATGVGTGAAITDTTDKARIKALNAHLLQQIGADRGELKALIDDLADLTYDNTAISAAIYNGGYAMAPQKAKQLNNDSNFNLEFLKPEKDKDSGIQLA
jgi:hypothetical protein